MIHDGVMPSGSLLHSILETITELAMISSYSLKTMGYALKYYSKILQSPLKVDKMLLLMHITLIMREAICIS